MGVLGLINHYLGLIGIRLKLARQPGFGFLFHRHHRHLAMDAFIFIILLAGLQALPSEVLEASRIDGAIGGR